MKQKLLSILTLFFFAVVISGCDCCECEVTFDFGIAGIENKVETYKKGTELILERNEVLNDTLTLRGWAESPNGQPKYSITVDDDITLYAVWKKSYEISYVNAFCTNYPNSFYSTTYTTSSYKEGSLFYTYYRSVEN